MNLGVAANKLPHAGVPDTKLMCVLAKHAGTLPWAASVFQPSMTQSASLLPVLLEAHGQDAPAHADAGS